MSIPDPNLHTVSLESFSDQELLDLHNFMNSSYQIAKVLGISVEEFFIRGMKLWRKALQEKEKGRVVCVAGLAEGGETLKINEIILV